MVSLQEPKKEEKRRGFLINCAYYAVIAVILWFLAKYVIGWLLPFLIAFFIAALVQPVVAFLHRRLHINRRLGGVLTVLVFALAFGALVTFAVTKIVGELTAVSRMLPQLLGQLALALERITAGVSGYLDTLPSNMAQGLAGALQNLSGELTRLSSLSSGVVSLFYSVVTRVPTFLLTFIITIVAACFMSMDYAKIRAFVMRQLPKKAQAYMVDIKNYFFVTVFRLLRAYLTLMLITFVELSVGLTLFRIPHSVVIAAMISVVDILPILGTGTVMIPWALVALITGQVYLGLCLVALYAVVTVVRNILEPKIVGDRIGLYPLITLIAMFVGLKVFGVAGMFLLPITIIIVKHFHDTGVIHLWKD